MSAQAMPPSSASVYISATARLFTLSPTAPSQCRLGSLRCAALHCMEPCLLLLQIPARASLRPMLRSTAHDSHGSGAGTGTSSSTAQGGAHTPSASHQPLPSLELDEPSHLGAAHSRRPIVRADGHARHLPAPMPPPTTWMAMLLPMDYEPRVQVAYCDYRRAPLYSPSVRLCTQHHDSTVGTYCQYYEPRGRGRSIAPWCCGCEQRFALDRSNAPQCPLTHSAAAAAVGIRPYCYSRHAGNRSWRHRHEQGAVLAVAHGQVHARLHVQSVPSACERRSAHHELSNTTAHHGRRERCAVCGCASESAFGLDCPRSARAVLDRVHYYDARVAHGCASAQVYDDGGDTVSRVTRFNMPPIPDSAVPPEHPPARSAADAAAAPPQQPSLPPRAAAAPARAVPHAGSAATTVLRVDLRAPAQGEPRGLAERQQIGLGAPHGELHL